MKLTGSGVLAVVGVAVGAVLLWRAWRLAGPAADAIGKAAAAAGAAINPADPDNLVNRGVSAVGGAIVTDPEGNGKNADGSWTLGGWLFDVTHPDAWGGRVPVPIVPDTYAGTAPYFAP